MKYFAHITADHWLNKNGLQKQLHRELSALDRTLLNFPQTKKLFIKKLKDVAAQAHADNPRCKEIKCYLSSYSNNKTQEAFIVPGVLHFTIYKVEEEM